MRRCLAWILVGAVAPFFCGACEEKKRSEAAARGDAGAQTDKFATADPKLAKALQAAAAGTGAADDGPPPDGVFASGAADRRHPTGQPTKIELVSDGAEPRLLLLGAPDAKPDAVYAATAGPAVLEVAMQMGPRVALPTIDFSLLIAAVKGEDAGPFYLTATVKRAMAAKEQLGQLPPDVNQQIGTLDGTQVAAIVTSDGRESDVRLTLGRATKPELERVASNAAEALVLMTVPLPAKPVGVGAQWLAETRMPWSGIDVIAYRAYRVQSISGHRATLALTVKAYAASTDTQLQGLPKGASLVQADIDAQGESEVVPGELLVRKGELQQRMVLVFQGPGDAPPAPAAPGRPPGNSMTAQMQGHATLIRGEDLRAEAAKVH